MASRKCAHRGAPRSIAATTYINVAARIEGDSPGVIRRGRPQEGVPDECTAAIQFGDKGILIAYVGVERVSSPATSAPAGNVEVFPCASAVVSVAPSNPLPPRNVFQYSEPPCTSELVCSVIGERTGSPRVAWAGPASIRRKLNIKVALRIWNGRLACMNSSPWVTANSF